jgi:hypothetical protein
MEFSFFFSPSGAGFVVENARRPHGEDGVSGHAMNSLLCFVYQKQLCAKYFIYVKNLHEHETRALLRTTGSLLGSVHRPEF